MRAPRLVVMAMIVAATGSAASEPKPLPVDIKPWKHDALVLQDAQGGTYVVILGSTSHLFYGTGTTLYAQTILSQARDGDAWSLGTWTPRLADLQMGDVRRNHDGTYLRWCDDRDTVGLTEVTGDKAKRILDKSSFMTSPMVYQPHRLMRDEAAVYYYVDRLGPEHAPAIGYRVFVGKKGAMKQLPLVDLTTDSAGEFYATKSGELRIVTQTSADKPSQQIATWVRGEKSTALVMLDRDVNSPLIFRDLGIYKFTGTLCDNH